MQANTFDVVERRKRVTVFKLGKLWVFKQFFDNHELFNALLDHYNKDLFRFEFKSTGARNNALKLLERNGFDYDLVEDLKGYVAQLPKSAKYARILKNSVAYLHFDLRPQLANLKRILRSCVNLPSLLIDNFNEIF